MSPGAPRAANGPGTNFLVGLPPFAASKYKDNVVVNLVYELKLHPVVSSSLMSRINENTLS